MESKSLSIISWLYPKKHYIFTALVSVSCYAQSSENITKPTDNDLVEFSQLKQKPWYKKINVFAELGQEYRNINVSRVSENQVVTSDYFKGDYDATLLSLTLGGNLFRKTSLYLDLTRSRSTLKGDIQTQGKDSFQLEDKAVRYQRNKILTEIFFERQLSQGFTAGFDLYYSYDPYANVNKPGSFLDEGYGGGLLLSRQFKLKSSYYRVDYILSHRRVTPGVKEQEKN